MCLRISIPLVVHIEHSIYRKDFFQANKGGEIQSFKLLLEQRQLAFVNLSMNYEIKACNEEITQNKHIGRDLVKLKMYIKFVRKVCLVKGFLLIEIQTAKSKFTEGY